MRESHAKCVRLGRYGVGEPMCLSYFISVGLHIFLGWRYRGLAIDLRLSPSP